MPMQGVGILFLLLFFRIDYLEFRRVFRCSSGFLSPRGFFGSKWTVFISILQFLVLG